jgi:Ni,Fe-hydrogenase I large subunit
MYGPKKKKNKKKRMNVRVKKTKFFGRYWMWQLNIFMNNDNRNSVPLMLHSHHANIFSEGMYIWRVATRGHVLLYYDTS